MLRRHPIGGFQRLRQHRAMRRWRWIDLLARCIDFRDYPTWLGDFGAQSIQTRPIDARHRRSGVRLTFIFRHGAQASRIPKFKASFIPLPRQLLPWQGTGRNMPPSTPPLWKRARVSFARSDNANGRLAHERTAAR